MTSEPPPAEPPAEPSVLRGVGYGQLTSHGDARGAFTELWRASSLAGAAVLGATAGPFVQANLSTSSAGVLRGLHLHRRQLDYWVVVAGRAFVALVDARAQLDGSALSGPPAVETRELGPNGWVVIPAGVAHGFLALETLQLLYLVTNEYDGSDELGFAWDDSAVGVPWPAVPATPDGQPIVSRRDASNPSLAELVARIRG